MRSSSRFRRQFTTCNKLLSKCQLSPCLFELLCVHHSNERSFPQTTRACPHTLPSFCLPATKPDSCYLPTRLKVRGPIELGRRHLQRARAVEDALHRSVRGGTHGNEASESTGACGNTPTFLFHMFASNQNKTKQRESREKRRD
jgi:hypothetical protein